MLEFTLVAVPLIFILVSIVELSRGMWLYSTLAFSVRTGTRYAVVHGANCASASSSCPVTLGALAQVIQSGATGLPATQLNITLATANTSKSCAPLSTCLTDSSTWPPTSDNTVGTDVTISGTYPFHSALAMFWPGSGKVNFSTVNLAATSQEEIVF